VEPDALGAAHAKDSQPVVVLQPSKFPFHGGTASVEPLSFVALARDPGLTVTAVAAERDDRDDVPVGALGVDAAVVVAHVESTRNGSEPATALDRLPCRLASTNRLTSAGLRPAVRCPPPPIRAKSPKQPYGAAPRLDLPVWGTLAKPGRSLPEPFSVDRLTQAGSRIPDFLA
jgi:hypothetical protein